MKEGDDLLIVVRYILRKSRAPIFLEYNLNIILENFLLKDVGE
jgi:hypothetical protein